MKRFIAVQVLFLLLNAVFILFVGRGIERWMHEGDKKVLAAVSKTMLEVKKSVDEAGVRNAADIEKEIADRLTAAAYPCGRKQADASADESRANDALVQIQEHSSAAPAKKTEQDSADVNDYKRQVLMEEGTGFYGDKNYGRAAAAFKKVLGFDGENRLALVYYCASVFKLNPGDDTETRKLKKILEPLTGDSRLEWKERYTAIEVLQGISIEEGDSAAAHKYADLLKNMEADR